MLEKTSNVFKQGYSDDLYQEIVSFLNSCKGKILIGYDENGTLIGLDDAKFLKEKITKEILNKITPNCSMFVTIDNLSLDNKDYIVINVNKGIDIYFLKDKFLFDGIYVRKDSYSVPCTFEIVKQMIIQNYNLNYEWGISMNQNLSFDYIIKKFKEIGQDINDDCVQKNLHL